MQIVDCVTYTNSCTCEGFVRVFFDLNACICYLYRPHARPCSYRCKPCTYLGFVVLRIHGDRAYQASFFYAEPVRPSSGGRLVTCLTRPSRRLLPRFLLELARVRQNGVRVAWEDIRTHLPEGGKIYGERHYAVKISFHHRSVIFREVRHRHLRENFTDSIQFSRRCHRRPQRALQPLCYAKRFFASHVGNGVY